MYQHKTILGFIPARAGSKGLPGKNIRLLAGKPLIAHTIEAAQKSKIFDYLIVSTDGKEIAQIAKETGAEVPFLRPPKLATDTAKGTDVLHHALGWLEERKKKFDWIMVLQPTSPLRSSEDILNACNLMVKLEAQAVVSVCETEHHPWWCNILPEDHCMANFIRPDAAKANRQDLPVFYRVNGAIYLAAWDFIRKLDSWYGPKTYAYLMPPERSIDIDNFVDFALAETLITYQKQI